MCGIIAFLGETGCFEHIYNGLQMLQNRGYDGAGICTINKNRCFVVNKYATTETSNAIERLKNDKQLHISGSVGLGHTRWLTHGDKTDQNAHPHIDYKNRIALVHNGIIENYYQLKQELISLYDVEFKSETDSEVIVNLISVLYDKNRNLEEAIRGALLRLDGTWALGIISIEKPENLYCASHGCPLLIGYGGNSMMLASEQSGFSIDVDNYFCMNDRDFIVVRKENNIIHLQSDTEHQIKYIKCSEKMTMSPYPYPHWTLREIKEQPESSARSIDVGGRLDDGDQVNLVELDLNKKKLLDANHLILLGCGTSFYAGLHGANFFKELADLDTVQIIDGGEFKENDIPRSGNTIFILLSQSGETKDLHRCIEIAKVRNIFMIGVVNVVDSLIAREVNCRCYLNAGREIAVASTKSFTSQIIMLAMIAVWFGQNKNIYEIERKQYIKDLVQLPNDIKDTIEMSEKLCEEVAKFLVDKPSCFVLGKGWCESIAKEGSLKIKEIGYIHAEGYSAVALKHGPFSLLQADTPVIFVNPNDDNYSRVNNAIEEVRSRNTPIILITDVKPQKKNSYEIIVPQNNTFKGIIHIVPMQLIAYYLSIWKNINPDMPRNLAKCITVD
ncbi:MAG: glucosamine-fructose-6-phosphate aminotransferase [Hyperionvirus sp.]|uniref:glutamine--fructose-6-phosphate transaminase (isomerizing) n=1 Tax=Hyperionvirus sp. TaxID=2487770 RepID=A0A3G5AC98_9VIRU|nr:MAG: glucosamine-fructose-6-phosphate aminotransferase [Hyperionvirus sp.]